MSTDQRTPTRSPVELALSMNEDIWDLIASELVDDQAALRAAALVSSAMRSPMQRTLFRTVYLDCERLDQFVASLLFSLALSGHIRWLNIHSPLVLQHLLIDLDGGGAPDAFATRVRGLRIGPDIWCVNECLPMLAAQFAALNVLELAHITFLDARGLQRALACFPNLHTLRWHRSCISIPHIEQGTLALPRVRDFHWDEETYVWTDNTYDERVKAWARAGAWEHLERFAVCARATARFCKALERANTTLRHLRLIQILSAGTLDAVFPSQDRRSNTLLTSLETLVLDISLSITSDVLHALSRLLGSLSSRYLHSLMLVVAQVASGSHASINWQPLVDSVLDLHRELSPGVRKSVCVFFLGFEGHQDCVPPTRDGLSCLSGVADVDVGGVSEPHLSSTIAGPVPHFPLLTYLRPTHGT